jgi:DNA-binding response OmpR family regulator
MKAFYSLPFIRGIAMTQADGSEGSSQDTKVILVVEDDTHMGAFFVDALQKITSHQFLLVPDADHALETVKTIIPNLFILDYGLPGINGLELYERLHAQEPFKNTPFLLISANLSRQEAKKYAVAFLKKPFELDELLAKIEELLADKPE